MKIRLISAAVAAVLSAWAPNTIARETVVLPYIFGVAPGDSVGQATGVDTTGAGLLTINNNININTLNDIGGGITSDTNNVASILFIGNSTITGFTGTSLIRFLDITAGANNTTVNFNGDVFSTQFHHAGTGTVNFNGSVNEAIVASSYIFNGDGFLSIGANQIFNSALTTTAGDNTGTLTFNGGSSMIGAIGAESAALKQINLVGGDAQVTGAIFVKGFDLGSNTFSMTGALTSSFGGVIATTFASNSNYGNIVVNGAANIDAAGITVIPTVTGALTSGTTYKILSADSGTSDAIVSVINNNPRYTFAGLPTSLGEIDIVLTSITPLVTLVTSPEASVVAPILEVNAPINTDLRVVQDAIAVLPSAGAINNALAQLAPANTNLAAPWVAAQATQLITDTWMTRLDEIQNMCCDTACDTSNKNSTVANKDECKSPQKLNSWWIKAVGKVGTQDDSSNLNGYQSKAVGVMLGYDVAVSENTRVGLGGGYVNSNINGNHSDNKTKIDSYHLTTYFKYAPDAFFIQGAMTAGIDRYDGARNIQFAGINRQAKSDVNGQQFTASIALGKHFGFNEITMTPLIGLHATYLHLASYKEHGAGDVNLRVDSQDYNFLRSSVGLKIERLIKSEGSTLAPELHARWLHDFNSTTMEQDALFTGGGTKFSMQGIKQDRDTYNVGAGLTFLSCDCDKNAWSVKGLYDYKWNESNYDSHQVSLIASIKF
jgi:outer membrane autotransporter protein